MVLSKDEALARRRAQNREAQRKFRFKQNQRKNQHNAEQARLSQSQKFAPTSSHNESLQPSPTECRTQDHSSLSDLDANKISSRCSLDLYGDISSLDFSGIEVLLTPRPDSKMTDNPSVAQLADILRLSTEHASGDSRFSYARAYSTRVNRTFSPSSLSPSESQWSRTGSWGMHMRGDIENTPSESITSSDSGNFPTRQSSPPLNSSSGPLENSHRDSLTVDDPPNSSGNSNWVNALHIAAQKGHVRIVCTLLQHGVSCNEKDSEGLTPLMHAIIGDHKDVIASLLRHNDARIGEVDGQKRTALHWAVLQRREILLEILLEHCSGDRVDVDSHDVDGKTPLHLAVETGFETGVSLLMAAGASLKLRTPKF